MTVSDIAQLGVLALTAAAVFVTLRGLRDQLWLQTFTDYTRRYLDVIEGLPDAARLPPSEWSPDLVSAEDRRTIDRSIRRYLNLCSEEFYLHDRGRIDRRTWDVWRDGMRATMALPAFQDGWVRLGPDYGYYGEFHRFMADLVGDVAGSDSRLAIPADPASTAPMTPPARPLT
jgi:hypothetical protein